MVESFELNLNHRKQVCEDEYEKQFNKGTVLLLRNEQCYERMHTFDQLLGGSQKINEDESRGCGFDFQQDH